MKSRRLGKTGYQVSEIGIGCWQFGGDFGPIEDETSTATLTAAKHHDVSFFDTADVYGAGRSERVIGGFAKAAGSDMRIATKVGRMPALYPNQCASRPSFHQWMTHTGQHLDHSHTADICTLLGPPSPQDRVHGSDS